MLNDCYAVLPLSGIGSKERAASTNNLRRGHVFFDVLSTVMINYSARTAAWLHAIPLVVLTLAVLGFRWATLRGAAIEAVTCILSLLCAALGSGLLGVVRVLLTGKPALAVPA